MSQSNVIFAYLAFAFVVFITMKGELPLYMGFLLGDPTGAAPGSTAKTTIPQLPSIPSLPSPK